MRDARRRRTFEVVLAPTAASGERDPKLCRRLRQGRPLQHLTGPWAHVGKVIYQRPAGRSTRSESRSSRTPCAGRRAGPFPRASLGGVRSRGTDLQASER